jgi:hypothetical protein
MSGHLPPDLQDALDAWRSFLQAPAHDVRAQLRALGLTDEEIDRVENLRPAEVLIHLSNQPFAVIRFDPSTLVQDDAHSDPTKGQS